MNELFSIVGTVHRALDYHSSRHNLLASNIANADTPGFRPQELVRVPEGATTHNMPMAATREGHLQSAEHPVVEGAEVIEEDSGPIGADGNAVSLDREMAKLNANNIRYETATTMVKRKLATLRYVANDGVGG